MSTRKWCTVTAGSCLWTLDPHAHKRNYEQVCLKAQADKKLLLIQLVVEASE